MEFFAELDRAVEELRSSISKRLEELRSFGRELAREGVAYAIDARRGSASSTRVVGVDGSRALVERLGSTALYIVKAVAVSLGDAPRRFTKLLVLEDPLDERLEACAEDCMSALEALAYESVGSDVEMLLIDGPIVDPPRAPYPCSRVCAEDLHERRAKTLARIVGRGATVLGFVKRLRASISGVPAPIAFRAICAGVRDQLGVGEGTTVVVPHDPALPQRVAETYRRLGLEFVSLVVCDPRRDEPYRIDVAPPDALRTSLEALSSIPRTWDGVPIHVALAHELAKIPRDLVELARIRVRRALLALNSSNADRSVAI